VDSAAKGKFNIYNDENILDVVVSNLYCMSIELPMGWSCVLTIEIIINNEMMNNK